MKLYVGNLSYDMTEQDLVDLFSQHGTVDSANLIIDKFTNQSKGFAFVEMSSKEEAEAAIEALDGTDQQGRSMKVNVARPKEDNNNRRGGGGGRGGNRRDGGHRSGNRW